MYAQQTYNVKMNVGIPVRDEAASNPSREQNSLVSYEQPLNERVRTFLRLEHLFRQIDHHRSDLSQWGRRAALAAILDVLMLLSRSDLRVEIMKVLEEQHSNLSRLVERSDIDHHKLSSILQELEQLNHSLQDVNTNFANTLLRNHEFLNNFLNRCAIPGGTCGFDMPAFHHWLNQPVQVQQANLDTWSQDLQLYKRAVAHILSLLRTSMVPIDKVADGGVYIHTMESVCQLVRVLLPAATKVFPEISAGRHRCTIRFMLQDNADQRPQQTYDDIHFLFVCGTV